PPVRPPQPAGVTEAAYGRPKWNASSGADRYRRSLYTFSKRTAPFAMFATFDAPSGEACIARRNRSNSPLQALTLLNDVMLMDIAQQSGQRLATTSGDDAERIAQLFRRTLVRTPAAEELALCRQYLDQQRLQFARRITAARQFAGLVEEDSPEEKIVERAAWTALSRSVFGLDETLTRE
ncbi:MAG: DUF1553 domain-containing protein, partial [Planctomycetaceae bacterium]|nr:DUF1553 domain-containing protein [Planctomycetaceae bacterium]